MTRLRVHLKGIHRVTMRLADGSRAEYHYAWRGGPRIWDRSMAFCIHSIEYVEAYQEATNARIDTSGTFREVIDEFLSSAEFDGLGERTRKDHRLRIAHANGIEATFGAVPIKAFEDKRIRPKIMRWRDTFSKGTGDNMMSTMQRIVSFAYRRGLIGEHHLLRVHRQVKSNRAGIVWTREEIGIFCAGAPRYVVRILIAAVETGFRPGDLQVLTRAHLDPTAGKYGRFLLKTRKSRGRNFAAVPVTERMAALIAEMPEDQENIIVNTEGRPFRSVSEIGGVVSEWRDALGIRKELHLYDARGTAVTRLVRAGCSMAHLAIHMGWSPQHAAQMLERYAALDPEMSADILERVEAREAKDQQ